MVAWFPGPVEDTDHYFQRLNQGINTRQWESMSTGRNLIGSALCSALTQHLSALEGMGWRPFSLVSAKPGEEIGRGEEEKEEEEEAE